MNAFYTAHLAPFVIDKHISFAQQGSSDDGGLWVAHISNAHGTASICLQGAHLMHWYPKEQNSPVVWMSQATNMAQGKSIRGGVPVCWPWFGAHASEANFPAHGFARTVPWQVISSRALDDGSTEIAFTLQPSDATRAQWPHDSQVSLLVNVGKTLKMALTTRNTGSIEFSITEALHTYFHISDIGSVRVTGLDNTAFMDKAAGGVRGQQLGDITFNQEFDRVYVNSSSACVIEDATLKRHIHINKIGSQSTVVWNPWQDKADKMGDMGAGSKGQSGWREMLCVESANALENAVAIAAGKSHTLAVEYSVHSLA
ncbi:MAG TPA: D-hexose-6-phosphate mutarotase [Burkholderiaceae bacterium]|nr:D-hexose-6-phosphate mutarotase [Burkholderiaceae bacterium]